MPIYNMAMKAVDDLDKNDITEVRGFTKPPDGAKAVMKTLCILFGVAPEKVKSQNVKEVIWDYWEPAKKKLLTPDLLKRCK
jgi:dynein heavy chain